MEYSISDLEQLTGVQTHTIRIWERRYHALSPLRSAGNTRLYDDQQLRRLLNIVSLQDTGLKISHVCALSDEEMNTLITEEISQHGEEATRFEYYISQALISGMGYNEHRFDELISTCISDYGLDKSYRQVIYPLLVRLGLMWRSDKICPAQEHFMSNILKQKLYKAIDELPIPESPVKSWLLFLPEDEGHDMGLLYAHYLLKAAGHKVVFLGGRLPLNSLVDALDQVLPDHLLLFLVRNRPISEANSYIQEIYNRFSQNSIYLAGNSKLIKELQLPANVNWLQSITEFEHMVNNQLNAS